MAERKKLGFGLMRLPMKDGQIDLEMVKEMVDRFMAKGFTYFDTAYVYGGGQSEIAAREALVKRYPRESYQLATKLPVWMAQKSEDYEGLFQTQLERTGAGYFDYYLLHALGRESYQKTEELGAWAFGKGLKERGLVRKLGFSFHADAECLDEILTAHPEAEFVQLQINYVDWEDGGVQARKCYEVARKHNTPIIIMEPVKGGSLASMLPDIQSLFKAARPDDSVASWAMRYTASLEGVEMVLSGMSALDQLEDNMRTMGDLEPLTDADRSVIAQVVDALSKVPTVPCTACRYCVDDCPQKINIPGAFQSYNNLLLYDNLEGAKHHYGWATGEGGKASACIECGVCESHCPQHIRIPELLKKVAGAFE